MLFSAKGLAEAARLAEAAKAAEEAPKANRNQPDAPAFAAAYYDLLAGCARGRDIWETEYLQVLDGNDPVLEWVKGTGLRPILNGLDDDERAIFLGEYARRLRAAYPVRTDGRTLYPMLEGALTTDPDQQRLIISEFDIATRAYTGVQWFYRLESASHAMGDLTTVSDRTFLVIERDNLQGDAAQFKKVFLVDAEG